MRGCLMNGKIVAGLIIILVGLANVGYGIYRDLALDKSMMPGVPVGIAAFLLATALLRGTDKPDS